MLSTSSRCLLSDSSITAKWMQQQHQRQLQQHHQPQHQQCSSPSSCSSNRVSIHQQLNRIAGVSSVTSTSSSDYSAKATVMLYQQQQPEQLQQKHQLQKTSDSYEREMILMNSRSATTHSKHSGIGKDHQHLHPSYNPTASEQQQQSSSKSSSNNSPITSAQLLLNLKPAFDHDTESG